MKVEFSALADEKLQHLLLFLQENWSKSVRVNFLEAMNSTIAILAENPKAFPIVSDSHAVRRCVITSQTSILYELQNDTIYVLTLTDSRQDPTNWRKELAQRGGGY